MDGADRITRRANVGIVDRPCHCSPTLNLGFPAIRVSGDWLMRRRNFLRVLGGAAAWPLVARAQQPAVPVIGFVRNTSLLDSTQLVIAFRQGLRETGFVEGQNVTIEYRWAEGQHDRL